MFCLYSLRYIHISNKLSGLIRFICNNSKRLFFYDMAIIRLQVYNFGVENFIKGLKSGTNVRKMTCNDSKLDLVNINARIKFGENQSICS